MPTIRRCCIIGCTSNSRERPQLQFFQFPKPENPFHKLWKQACINSLSRILPFKKPVVCALHFHPKHIGGRRLTSSAVPVINLDVPSNLKAVEQLAMAAEIERSRKCAYINAVVYEWLVRANLNPNLRGSITHGMIKDKALIAKDVIELETFIPDNRWLNRFRETHLSGFAAKLASNQLKPLGPSLWIPDIVKDLADMFPPTQGDRMENVPEQYFIYMQQYGEYEEEDSIREQSRQSVSYSRNTLNNSNYKLNPNNSYETICDSNFSSPQDSSNSRSPPPLTAIHSQKRAKLELNSTNLPNTPSPTSSIKENSASNGQDDAPDDDDDVQIIMEPTVIQDLTSEDEAEQPKQSSVPENQATQKNFANISITNNKRLILRLKGLEAHNRRHSTCSSPKPHKKSNENTQINGENSSPKPTNSSFTTIPVNGANCKSRRQSVCSSPMPSKKTSAAKLNSTHIGSAFTSGKLNNTPTDSASTSGKLNNTHIGSAASTAGKLNNTHTASASTSGPANNRQSANSSPKLPNKPNNESDNELSGVERKELMSYEDALRYLKSLEDFVLHKENFRAIGLIAQLEVVLRRGASAGTASSSNEKK